MITYAEYTKRRHEQGFARRDNRSDLESFEAAQPAKCPKCGVQVFDPFGWRLVMHDVARCLMPNVGIQPTAKSAAF